MKSSDLRQKISELNSEIHELFSKQYDLIPRINSLSAQRRGKKPKDLVAQIETQMQQLQEERKQLLKRMESLKSQASLLELRLQKVEKAEKLIQQQADRDAVPGPKQTNSSGKRPNQQRDIGW